MMIEASLSNLILIELNFLSNCILYPTFCLPSYLSAKKQNQLIEKSARKYTKVLTEVVFETGD